MFGKDQQMNKVCSKYNLIREFSELAYSPIIQSGGKYDLRPQAESNNDILKFDTIILSCGFKYISYHANIVRTMFISPDKKIQNSYKIVEEIFEYIINKLKPGVTLSTIYEGANKIGQQLDTKLPLNFGFGMGLEFKEGNLIIKEGNDMQVQDGMVFNVNIAIDNMQNEKGKNYAIQISDTVIVKQVEISNIIATNGAERRFKHISFTLNEEDDDNESEESEGIQKNNVQQNNTSKSGYNTRSQRFENKQKAQVVQKLEQQRNQNQRQLLTKKNEEIKKRSDEGHFNGIKTNQNAIDVSQFKDFKDDQEIENEYKNICFQVDLKKLVILIPLNGRLIPFNGNLLKSFSKVQENSNIRLNFHIPGASNSTSKFKWPKLQEKEVYIKECTLSLKNASQFEDYMKKLKDLQSKIKTIDFNKASKLDFEQEQIMQNKQKKLVLKELKIRPNISQKRISGWLECHLNGFRYKTVKNDVVDIAFSNIKHAFFQPCINDIIVILHFNLHNSIIIGKKKTDDVQFYGEIQIANEDTMARRRGDDEYEEEQREKQMRKRLNKEFYIYTEAIAQQTQIKFDTPQQKFAFWGSTNRTNCQIVPTANCFINITEQSPFILSLEDVEVACFERMLGGLKNCDLVFIYKDYDRAITRISSIPIEYVDTIQNLLDKRNILFFIMAKSLNWSNVLQSIKADLLNFIEEGGWNFLIDDDDDDKSVQSQKDSKGEDDEEFLVDSEDFQDDGSESGSDEEEESESNQGSDNESSYEDDDQKLSEEGQDWDELEQQAQREDRRRQMQSQQSGMKPNQQKTVQQRRR